ncbi:Ni/Fe hydrogenase subunit alpha [candidate division KSB1 bacterium]
MSKTITISPVSRVEGHGKVTIHLDENNEVKESYFHVVEFRGFEQFTKGRLLSDMPVITTRICGICPVSHHLASAKACDDVLGVDIPPAAKMLRELMHMGQIINSHALHFFYLAAPDFILGPDADPAKRNIIGVIEKDPELAKKAIAFRKIGQEIVECVGGRSIHPLTAIPGGMSKPLSHEDRFMLSKKIEKAIEYAQLSLTVGKSVFEKYADLVPDFAKLDTHYMGLVKDGELELYDGYVRLIDKEGKKLEEFKSGSYLDYIGEHVEDWSYLKFPFYKKQGFPEGVYRVGPLARLNTAERISTPLAQKEFEEYKSIGSAIKSESLYYHYARLIEMLYASERAKELLADDEIVNHEVRIKVKRKAGEGIGIIEAPRGTLIHHYWADDMGKIEKVNLVVATVHNNQAMNMSVNDIARKHVRGGEIPESALNLVEMAIRCYDPCLSCSTHAVGQMPLEVKVLDHLGEIVSEIKRNS